MQGQKREQDNGLTAKATSIKPQAHHGQQEGEIMYKEIRKMNSGTMRLICIENNWYTCGNNREYTELLDEVAKAEIVVTNTIEDWAKNILEHSDTGAEIESIMFAIGQSCYTNFVKE